MKKILLIAAFVALSGGSAFAGNLNLALVGQTGFGNISVVDQGGNHNVNSASVGQLGGGNLTGIEQGGSHNINHAVSFQFGFGNASIISQN